MIVIDDKINDDNAHETLVTSDDASVAVSKGSPVDSMTLDWEESLIQTLEKVINRKSVGNVEMLS